MSQGALALRPSVSSDPTSSFDVFLAQSPWPLAICNEMGVVLHQNQLWREWHLSSVSEARSVWEQEFTRAQTRARTEFVSNFGLRPALYSLGLSPAEAGHWWVRVEPTLPMQESFHQTVNEAKLAEMAAMTGSIAHEINNPLTIIAGKAQLVLSKLRDHEGLLDPTYLETQMMKIAVNAERITKIVKGMRNFGRDTSHDVAKRFRLYDSLEESLTLCGEKLRTAGVEVLIEGSLRQVEVEAHPIFITQVFVNLLNNAVDALEGVREPQIKINLRGAGAFQEILIIDNGSGVSLELEKKIFNPFFTTKAINRGTGLGLSLCLKMARQVGGDLYLDRAVSPSCFALRLKSPLKTLA